MFGIPPESVGVIVGQAVALILGAFSALKAVADWLQKREANRLNLSDLEDENQNLKIENQNLKIRIELIIAKCNKVREAGLKWKARALACEEVGDP